MYVCCMLGVLAHSWEYWLLAGSIGYKLGVLAHSCNLATERLGHRDVRGLSSMDPRLNCGLASALSSMMLTHMSGRPGEPPPPCLGGVMRVVRTPHNFGDKDRPPSSECDV